MERLQMFCECEKEGQGQNQEEQENAVSQTFSYLTFLFTPS